MNPLRGLLDRLLFIAGAVLLALISLAVALEVVFRYVLRDPIMWMGEFATIGLVWMVFLCAALAVSQKANLSIELIVKVFPGGIKKHLDSGIHVLLIFIFLLLIIIGTKYTIAISKAITGALQVSQAYFYSAVPVSAFFMLVYEVISLVESLSGAQKRG